MTVGETARYALGAIRLVNGVLGLLAPAVVVRRLEDDDPAGSAAATYGLRLFGIRNVVLGADLVRRSGPGLDRAVRAAPLIHASDAATVLALRRSRQLSPERARPLLLISATNTALALTALLASRRPRP